MRKININRMEVYGYHGCLDEEKERGQLYFISIELVLKGGFYDNDDDLTCTVNYASACALAEEAVRDNSFNLIESLAEKIAGDLLLSYEGLEGVTVTVEKPQAPVPVSFDTISATVSRKWHTAYLSLGANMLDRKKNVEEAIDRISASFGCKVVKCSQIIETDPWGLAYQPAFMNCAVEVKTWLDPLELLQLVKKIERGMGRTPSIKWGPRVIDIDILLYDLCVIMTEGLQIPHPYMLERKFVLAPLSEIAPNVIHPLQNKLIRDFFE